MKTYAESKLAHNMKHHSNMRKCRSPTRIQHSWLFRENVKLEPNVIRGDNGITMSNSVYQVTYQFPHHQLAHSPCLTTASNYSVPKHWLICVPQQGCDTLNARGPCALQLRPSVTRTFAVSTSNARYLRRVFSRPIVLRHLTLIHRVPNRFYV
jgi:hypothetical protein